ncbi:hypothetical protein GCM10009630_19500 [Kribbella jejuensis]|uniref:DUF3592 domain-containing protein n=1 Tax=Kribbella jejuensis TaxID=236068 RepID=A0A542EL65_9ACTN|nr:DUF3592 domain-containing protein [Kribbella jejuensis]TQJ16088.1 hypothetical protein FB475_0174 [Kribbella jejuensis]
MSTQYSARRLTRRKRLGVVATWTVFTAMALGIFSVGVVTLIWGVHRIDDLSDLSAHQVRAVGHVVATRKLPHNPQGTGGGTEATIGFTAADGTFHTTTQTLQLWSRSRHVGDKVAVVYDQRSPDSFYTTSLGVERLRNILILLLAATMLLGTPAAYIFYARDAL